MCGNKRLFKESETFQLQVVEDQTEWKRYGHRSFKAKEISKTPVKMNEKLEALNKFQSQIDKS